jgi:acyl-coenzyme A synthetase/AMP-(fatty) acid ligase
MRIGDAFADLAFTIAMETTGRWSRDRLLAAANEPAATQARTLRRILRACRDTELGQLYRFDSIDSVEAFRAAVPICDYEILRPFIDRQIATGRLVTAPERPFMYARTSGTTGAPKHIPVTRGVLRRLRRAQRAMAYVQHEALDALQWQDYRNRRRTM